MFHNQLFLSPIPLEFSLQGLWEFWLGDAERLRRRLTLSQMHLPPPDLQGLRLTSSSILPTKLQARSSVQRERRAAGSERGGYSSSWGRTRQCREDRQHGPRPPPPTVVAAAGAPPPSQLSSSEGVERKVVQNIMVDEASAWRSKNQN